MKLELHKIDGTIASTKVDIDDAIFGVEPNDHVMYQAVIAERANSRQGTAKTKGRSEVRGGGRKPWRQKGRGAARAGTSRSPLWAGGGRIFGPDPRSYETRLPKKVKRLARISALASKAKSNELTMTEDFSVESGKTKEMATILEGLGLRGKKTTLLIPAMDEMLVRAGKNIPNLRIRVADTASTVDILDCQMLVIQKSAIEKIQKVLLS